MNRQRLSTRSRSSIEKTLRLGQAVWFIAGGLLAIVSVWHPTVFGTISAADLGMVMFALSFVASSGAGYVAGRPYRAGLSLVAAGGFIALIVAPQRLGTVGVATLFLVGIFLVADSVIYDGVRNHFSG